MSFQEKYGPWAVISGAARGIGKAFAFELAERGISLLLIDILKEELHQTAQEILARFPVEIKEIEADLSNLQEVERAFEECKPYSVGLLCCNHAMTKLFPDGKLRAWVDTPLEDLQKMIFTNLQSSVTLIHHFARLMKASGRGGILILSSVGAVSGAPYVAQYGATKAFLANLGEALWWELKHSGVDVTTVLPGLTRTKDVEKGLTPYGTQKMSMMEPRQVAQSALDALGKKLRISPGWGNRLQHLFLARILPRRMSISFFGKIFPRCFHTISVDDPN